MFVRSLTTPHSKMAYSLVNHTSIIFGNPDENTYSSDEHIIKQSKIGSWQQFSLEFWFVGKSTKCIHAKYPMQTERIKLTHKIIDGKFHIYYNPKHEKDMIITYDEDGIKIGSKLILFDDEIFSDADYAHVFL